MSGQSDDTITRDVLLGLMSLIRRNVMITEDDLEEMARLERAARRIDAPRGKKRPVNDVLTEAAIDGMEIP